MAYADYAFYTSSYYGDILTEENAEKWLSRASDEVDALTFDRLARFFPENPRHADKVRKAVCAIAEALYQIEQQQQAASVQKSDDGTYRGTVASLSAGAESIHFATSGASGSSLAAAAADADTREKLIQGLAVRYLANVPDSKGVNLLYAGAHKREWRCLGDDQDALIGGG